MLLLGQARPARSATSPRPTRPPPPAPPPRPPPPPPPGASSNPIPPTRQRPRPRPPGQPRPARPPATGAAAAPASAPAADRPAPAPRADLAQPTPSPSRRTRDPAGFSDELVGDAIAQASDFLAAQFIDGEIRQGKEVSEAYRHGLNALCVYALLSAGQATRNRLRRHQPRHARPRRAHEAAPDGDQPRPAPAADRLRPQPPRRRPRPRRPARGPPRPQGRRRLAGRRRRQRRLPYDDRNVVRIQPANPRDVPHQKDKPDKPPAPLPWEQDPQEAPPAHAPPPAQPAAPAARGPIPPGGLADASDAIGIASDTDQPRLLLADGLHEPRTARRARPLPPPRLPQAPARAQLPAPDAPGKTRRALGLGQLQQPVRPARRRVRHRLGIEVPDAYWAAVQKHWLACQLKDGQWPYRKDKPGGYLAMTCAGVASLMIAHDALDAPVVTGVGRPPARPRRRGAGAGLAWIERNDNAVDVMGPRTVYLGYTLHGVSRVGLASGYKYLGPHDWYRELARKIVLSQWANGSWSAPTSRPPTPSIDTAYTLLFLARGRHPILMNKLRFDRTAPTPGYWANRPRDVANLARFAARELERPLNWQVVPIDRDLDRLDGLARSSTSPATSRRSSTDDDSTSSAAFVDAGGMLFTQADGRAPSASTPGVNRPRQEALPRRRDHGPPAGPRPLQRPVRHPEEQPARPSAAVSNGARTAAGPLPDRHLRQWAGSTRAREDATRARSSWASTSSSTPPASATSATASTTALVPRRRTAPAATVAVARVKYAGNWDPEPGAWPRFARLLPAGDRASAAVPSTSPGSRTTNPAASPAIAHLTGTAAYAPTPDELAALRAYVDDRRHPPRRGRRRRRLPLRRRPPGHHPPPVPGRRPAASRPSPQPPGPPRDHGRNGRRLAPAPPAPTRSPSSATTPRPSPRSAWPASARAACSTSPSTHHRPPPAPQHLAHLRGYDPAEAQSLMKNLILWSAEHPRPPNPEPLTLNPVP